MGRPGLFISATVAAGVRARRPAIRSRCKDRPNRCRSPVSTATCGMAIPGRTGTTSPNSSCRRSPAFSTRRCGSWRSATRPWSARLGGTGRVTWQADLDEVSDDLHRTRCAERRLPVGRAGVQRRDRTRPAVPRRRRRPHRATRRVLRRRRCRRSLQDLDRRTRPAHPHDDARRGRRRRAVVDARRCVHDPPTAQRVSAPRRRRRPVVALLRSRPRSVRTPCLVGIGLGIGIAYVAILTFGPSGTADLGGDPRR